MKIIYLGSGCFWGSQGYFNKIKGVHNTSVGYANGGKDGVTYEEVGKEQKHAEVVKVEYDETILSIRDILFLHMHVIDPFSKDKQGGDIGHQYRTGFYSEDPELVSTFKKELTIWEKENQKTQIEVEFLTDFTLAEEYHQKYLVKNPTGYCHINMKDIPTGYEK